MRRSPMPIWIFRLMLLLQMLFARVWVVIFVSIVIWNGFEKYFGLKHDFMNTIRNYIKHQMFILCSASHTHFVSLQGALRCRVNAAIVWIHRQKFTIHFFLFKYKKKSFLFFVLLLFPDRKCYFEELLCNNIEEVTVSKYHYYRSRRKLNTLFSPK